jgi:hypothetical protein
MEEVLMNFPFLWNCVCVSRVLELFFIFIRIIFFCCSHEKDHFSHQLVCSLYLLLGYFHVNSICQTILLPFWLKDLFCEVENFKRFGRKVGEN